LWPLSQGEIDSAADGFVDAIFRLDGSVRLGAGARSRPSWALSGPGDVACHQHGDRLAECC